MSVNVAIVLLCVPLAAGVRYCWRLTFGPEPGRHSWQKAALGRRTYQGRRRATR